MFFLLYRHTNDGVIDDFLKISDLSPKISEDSPKFVEGRTNIAERFRKCPKIIEDSRRLSRKTRRYFVHTPKNLRTI